MKKSVSTLSMKWDVFTGKERASFFKGYGKGISQGEFCYFAEGLYEFF